MLSTAILVTLFLGLIFTSIVLWLWFLRWGLRWTKAENVTRRRLIEALVGVTVLQFVAALLVAWLLVVVETPPIAFFVMEIAIAVLVPCLTIAHLFQLRFLRAVQAWLPTLVSTVLMSVITLGIVRPFLYESFVIPTNSMAPTIVGTHLRGVCPECGEPTFGSPIPAEYRFGSQGPTRMICTNFHVHTDASVAPQTESGDRIVVAKFYAPRRWDLVVFQYPEDPAEYYVKRLVGLPGETIHIEDGTVFVNGEPLTPPESIANIQYQSEAADWHRAAIWGTKDRPAELNDDEYFVLGDFSEQAKDSRYWQQPAPGQTHPYAVPESYMTGVVTHTFWPSQRMRIHR